MSWGKAIAGSGSGGRTFCARGGYIDALFPRKFNWELSARRCSGSRPDLGDRDRFADQRGALFLRLARSRSSAVAAGRKTQAPSAVRFALARRWREVDSKPSVPPVNELVSPACAPGAKHGLVAVVYQGFESVLLQRGVEAACSRASLVQMARAQGCKNRVEGEKRQV